LPTTQILPRHFHNCGRASAVPTAVIVISQNINGGEGRLVRRTATSGRNRSGSQPGFYHAKQAQGSVNNGRDTAMARPSP